MFIFFQHNKLSSEEKGQFIPIFIVVLVVLIVMAMVTVNLSKVSFIKTDTSNAADAGALAGGSVMASVFNGQAIANSELIVNYQMFFAEMATLTAAVIIAALTGAIACGTMPCPVPPWDCCPSPGCITGTSIAMAGIIAAIVSVAAFHIAQVFTYLNMVKQAENGREQAIEMAYRYAFLNSGIGNKLSSGSSAATAYNDFVRGKGVTSGNYTWTDGQARQHQVSVNVTMQDVDSYKLQYAALPTVAIIALLMLAHGSAFVESLECTCCSAGGLAAASAAAIVGNNMTLALAGLIPAWEFDSSGVTNVLFPICWVVDINHDKRLTVTTSQEHAGYDYGLWQATYPRVESKSVVSFQGNGSIYQPNPHFDADIVETD
jgi:uncharacterized protein YpmB